MFYVIFFSWLQMNLIVDYCLRQLGTRESKEITVEGRVQFDLLQVLSLYTLNN